MRIRDIIHEGSSNDIEGYKDMVKKTPYYKNVLKPELERYVRDKINEPIENIPESKLIHGFKQYCRVLYHGTPTGDTFTRVTFKERKVPKDTSLVAHEYINKLAKEKFGVPVRNGMFATIDYDLTSVYDFGKHSL